MDRIVFLDGERVSALTELTGGVGRTIVQSLEKEKSVRGLARELGLAPSTICYHLERLKKLELVEEIRQKYGDKRTKLYKATRTGVAYLVLLNIPRERKEVLRRELAGALSRKGYIVRDLLSLPLAIGAGFKIWSLLRLRAESFDVLIPSWITIADILLLLVFLATLIYIQRIRLLNMFKAFWGKGS